MLKTILTALFCGGVCAGYAVGAELAVPGNYATVQAAIDAAKPGDVVVVKAGTYNENVRLRDAVSLKGAARDKTVIKGAAGIFPVLAAVQCATGSIQGLTFEGTEPAPEPKDMQDAICLIKESNVVVDDCAARNGHYGFWIAGACTPTLRGCVVASDSLDMGIVVGGLNAAPTVTKNLCSGVKKVGISIFNGAKGVYEGNESVKNGRSGIEVAGNGTEVELRGNTCADNGGNGIYIHDKAKATMVGNNCRNNKYYGLAVDWDAAGTAEDNHLEGNSLSGLYAGEYSTLKQARNVSVNNGTISSAEMWHLMDIKDFAELEAIAKHLRRDKVRDDTGNWLLDDFYSHLTALCQTMSKEQETLFLTTVDEWKKAYPDSVTWRVLLAKAYHDFAYRERGTGWASEVTEEGWKGYHKYGALAWQVILDGEKCSEKDLNLYAQKINIALDADPGRPDSPELYEVLCEMAGLPILKLHQDPIAEYFAQGLAIDPLYYPLYHARVRPLLQRWGGRSGGMERFADESARRTAAQEGEAMYARIAAWAYEFVGEEDYQEEFEFDWTRMRTGFEDLRARYPKARWSLNYFARMAYLYEDRETAAKVFAEIKEDWDNRVWRDQAEYDALRAWATDGSGRAEGTTGEATVSSYMTDAIKNNDVVLVRECLDRGAEPNGVDTFGRTVLLMAIELNRPKVVQALLERGADPNKIANGKLPLIAALNSSDHDCVNALLAGGADPNKATEDGDTPLMTAAYNNRTDLCTLLIERGADVSAVSAHGDTALTHAVWNGNIEMIQLLVSKGANLAHRDRDGASLLHIAVDRGNVPIIEWLLAQRSEDLTGTTNTGRTLLMQAAKKGHVDAVKFLIDKGVDINQRDTNDKLTALGWAKKSGNQEIADFLVSKGATE